MRLRPRKPRRNGSQRRQASTCCFCAPATPRAASWPRPSSTQSARANSRPTARAAIHRARSTRSRSSYCGRIACPRRPAKQELGRIREAGCAEAGFRLHRLRPGRSRSVPGLAGPADDRALGHSRSRGRCKAAMRSSARRSSQAYNALQRRISIFVSLPLAKLDRWLSSNELNDIGRAMQVSCARAAAEAIGTALLLAVVVGSGIMGERLAGGNCGGGAAGQRDCHRRRPVRPDRHARADLRGTLQPCRLGRKRVGATHCRPALCRIRAGAGAGAFVGVPAAHAMFGLPVVQVSAHLRPTPGEGLGEVIATFGLVLMILLVSRFRREAIPLAVACFITSAYWFTSSTSFANPAVTLARAMTNTFAGISPDSVPLFIGGQLAGGVAATAFARWLSRSA